MSNENVQNSQSSQIITVRITHPCIDPSNRRATLLSEARAQFWGPGPQSQWDKEQTMCARVTQEHTLTWWLTHSVSHCRPLAHTQSHTSARRVGTWAWEKKQVFLCACGRGNFRFGGVPCGKHVTFLFDNYCWRRTVARRPLNPAKYRSAPGYCSYKHTKVTAYTRRSQDTVLHSTSSTKYGTY